MESLTWEQRHDQLADMHLATPERALMLARALGVLPSEVLMVGCQPENAEWLGEGLSAPTKLKFVCALVRKCCPAVQNRPD